MFNTDDIVDHSEAPLEVASMNFESKRYSRLDKNSVCVKPTVLALGYSFLFLVLGSSLIALWLARTFTSFEGPGSLPLALIGLLFLFSGFVIYYNHNEQVLIEKDSGVHFKRSWRFNSLTDRTASHLSFLPDKVEKLQLLSHVVKHRSNRSRRRNSYTQTQVNLVARSGDRHNLFMTLKPERAVEFAEQISQLLEVPIHRIG